MWRRLPARRLTSRLLSAFSSSGPLPHPLYRCILLPAASGQFVPSFLPASHPWQQHSLPRFASSSAVEAVSSEEVEELHHAVEEIAKLPPPIQAAGQVEEVVGREQMRRGSGKGRQLAEVAAAHGFGYYKFAMLRRRQIQIETEAWEQAAKEYRELLTDMCEQKLAPNLPYVKSLFLGWFEPLRDHIIAEQELVGERGARASHAPYFNMLPADMMAVITMHKLMGLLMTGNGDGSVRVIQAACQIGEAIEHEVGIHKFLEKTKKKSNKEMDNEKEVDDSDIAKEQERLRKKVTDLMKKQKLRQVRKIVKKQDASRPWGQDAHAKVGSRLIELMIETAYIQPPVSQYSDGPPDIRPAFTHEMRTVASEQQKNSRRYGVIKCDPLVRQGLDRTAKHMVIPYMPMLIPPISWTGYDKGAHLFLPSYVMRTRGARQQREAVKRAPREQMQSVFEALNTLGSTKWRVNKRVLNIVDRIWSSGGQLADLVDRADVPLPEKPDTEDEAMLKKWKWNLRSVKKENSERHSQRCDVELKLAVARKMKDEDGFYYPHNLDFRGLRWLKIHLANLYAGGVDKLSYDGRIAFTENHLEDIFDSADRPLEGKRWWLGAEDPFQFLAVCMNLTEALRSRSPETMISHIPVHQDGSCNGLQHYAALGRDKLGAIAVNLVAAEKPADVYSGIATRYVWFALYFALQFC
ncbi:hypothetical protein GUJ93_ZPchr0002g26150 [Zizania palustris]|uniref:DNA-directed RNA polymerase n=1 Tax=Zizania palustris TaxID=103762 RepID=A0A8J5S148_ZIZPA|nr:hypothetical protein GUJ93_ZPchr0002g26150 [Zizania palustris]